MVKIFKIIICIKLITLHIIDNLYNILKAVKSGKGIRCGENAERCDEILWIVS